MASLDMRTVATSMGQEMAAAAAPVAAPTTTL